MKPKPIGFEQTAPLSAKVVSAFPGFLIYESFGAVVYLRCLDVEHFVWSSKVFLFKFSLNSYLSVSLIYGPISWNSCWPLRNDCFWKILILARATIHKEFTHTVSLNPSRPPLMVDLSSQRSNYSWPSRGSQGLPSDSAFTISATSERTSQHILQIPLLRLAVQL